MAPFIQTIVHQQQTAVHFEDLENVI